MASVEFFVFFENIPLTNDITFFSISLQEIYTMARTKSQAMKNGGKLPYIGIRPNKSQLLAWKEQQRNFEYEQYCRRQIDYIKVNIALGRGGVDVSDLNKAKRILRAAARQNKL